MTQPHPGHDIPARLLIDPGPAYASAGRQFQGIPGLERTPGGRLWATWYGGGKTEEPGNYVLLTWSDDDGKSWLEPRLIVAPPAPDRRTFDPCLWCDPLGRLWLFYAQSREWHDGRAGVWASLCLRPDADPTAWTDRRWIDDGVMMNKPTVLSDGKWLLPIAMWAGREGIDPALRRAWVYASTDDGLTFTRLGGADVPDRTYDEHMVVERRDGALWMLVRTKYGIGQSLSRDGGLTWSPGQPSKIPHINTRFFIRRLASGRLLLVRHAPHPGDTSRCRLAAFLSDDEGSTWPHQMLLDPRKGVSYPDGFEDPQGRIHIIYDLNRGNTSPSPRDREILMVRFTEADLMMPTGDEAMADANPITEGLYRSLVNKATG